MWAQSPGGSTFHSSVRGVRSDTQITTRPRRSQQSAWALPREHSRSTVGALQRKSHLSQSGQVVLGRPGRRWGSLPLSTGPGEPGRPLGLFCELEPGRRDWTGGQGQGVATWGSCMLETCLAQGGAWCRCIGGEGSWPPAQLPVVAHPWGGLVPSSQIGSSYWGTSGAAEATTQPSRGSLGLPLQGPCGCPRCPHIQGPPKVVPVLLPGTRPVRTLLHEAKES